MAAPNTPCGNCDIQPPTARTPNDQDDTPTTPPAFDSSAIDSILTDATNESLPEPNPNPTLVRPENFYEGVEDLDDPFLDGLQQSTTCDYEMSEALLGDFLGPVSNANELNAETAVGGFGNNVEKNASDPGPFNFQADFNIANQVVAANEPALQFELSNMGFNGVADPGTVNANLINSQLNSNEPENTVGHLVSTCGFAHGDLIDYSGTENEPDHNPLPSLNQPVPNNHFTNHTNRWVPPQAGKGLRTPWYPPTPIAINSHTNMTAGEVAKYFSKGAIKEFRGLNTALSQRVAIRWPEPNPFTATPDFARPENVRSLLIQICEPENPDPCIRCQRGQGKWKMCVTSDSESSGACASCLFSAQARFCSKHCKHAPRVRKSATQTKQNVAE